jgi:hypothetical protein
MVKYTQSELREELLVSQNRYMTCTLCETLICYSEDGDEEQMEEHFEEKHGYLKGE